MRIFLIVNPSASSVTPRTRVVIQRALATTHDLTVGETARRGHATRLAQGAVVDGFDAVVVLGGDGTLNEAANGLAGSGVPLGALPGGSTNVFARTVGYSNDPVTAVGELLDAIADGDRRSIGLGNANGRYFLFHVGIGFDAAVVEHVERRASLKRYAGHPFFVWSTLLTWARWGERREPRFAVHIPRPDGGTDDVDGYLTICLNSNPYTFLGNRPFNVAPGLTFEKGFSVLTLRSLGMPTFLGVVASALMSGRHLTRHPRADFRSDVRELTVTGHGKFPYQLDGDYLGDVERLVLRHVPDVLHIYAPAEPPSR